MAEEKNYVTQEGYNALVAEQNNLIHNVRNEVIIELQEARAQGDLSENADYDAARDHQARVEARIQELEAMIKNAVIVNDVEKESGEKKVKFGSTVKILDLSDNTELEFQIVGSQEADPFESKISNESPIAKALLNHKVGDIVTVESPNGNYEIKITEIK